MALITRAILVVCLGLSLGMLNIFFTTETAVVADPLPDHSGLDDFIDDLKNRAEKGIDVLKGDRKVKIEIGSDGINVRNSPTQEEYIMYGLGLVGVIAILSCLCCFCCRR